MEKTIKIGGELESVATGGIVAAASAIKDKAKGKFQGEINAEVDASLEDRYTKEETYSKQELNSLITTPSTNYEAVEATEETTDVTDVLPATGEADTIYRVGSWDGSQYDATCYSEYAWKGDAYIHLSTKPQIGEVFDISAYHATGGTLATYADLSAALDSNNGGGVPQSLQKGGMSVKFIQGSAPSSDNNYIQARLMADEFTTDVTKWQGVDAELVEESHNLIEGGAVTALRDRVFERKILSSAYPITKKYIKADGEHDGDLGSASSEYWKCTELIQIYDGCKFQMEGSLPEGVTTIALCALYNAEKQCTRVIKVSTDEIIPTNSEKYIRFCDYIQHNVGYYSIKSISEKVDKIEQAVPDNPFLLINKFDETNAIVCKAIKEIYVSDSTALPTGSKIVAIKRSESDANRINIDDSNGNVLYRLSNEDENCLLISDDLQLYIVIDWTQIEAETTLRGDFTINTVNTKNIELSPYIAGYIKSKEIERKSFKEDFSLLSSNYGNSRYYLVKDTGVATQGSSENWKCSDYIFIKDAVNIHVQGNHINDSITIAALYDKDKVHTRSTNLSDASIIPNENEYYIRVCSFGDGKIEVYYNSLQEQIDNVRNSSAKLDDLSALSRYIYPQGKFKGVAGVNTAIPDLPFFDDTYIASGNGTIFNKPNVENGELLTAVKDGFSVKKINGAQGHAVTEETYDVVIVGAGTGGTAAAYALKGNNKTICLVEVLDMLGGNATAARVNSWLQALPSPHIQAIAEDLGIDISKNWIRGSEETIASFSNQAQEEVIFDSVTLAAKYESDLQNSVTIKKRHRFVSIAEKVDGVVKSIFVENLANHQIIRINASFFIDGSSDGVICRSACSVDERDYDWGADARAKYNESLDYETLTPAIKRSMNEPSLFYHIADGVDDSDILNACTTVYLDGDTIVKPSYIDGDGYGVSWVNPMAGQCYGQYGILTLEWGRDELYEEFKKRAIEHWKFVKLSCQQAYEQGQTTFRAYPVSNRLKGFVGVADFVGIRESYRVICDYMMRQSDLTTLLTSSNVESGRYIAESSHLVDFHNTGSIDGGRIAMNAFNENQLRPNGIKYGAIIPHNLKNVLIASRCYGASQIFLSADRVNGTMAMLGYSAGKAILICLEDGLSDVRNVSITKLQSNNYTKFASNVAHLETLYNAHCYE